MRILTALIVSLALLLPLAADAYDVLVLQSRRDPAFEEALAGFRANRRFSERVVVLADYADVDVTRIVREDRPALVLALGDRALEAARKLRQTPVIALISLGIHSRHATRSNLTGIGMFAPPERYLSLFQGMKKRRVGLIYHPAKSGWYVQLARQAAQRLGIELVTREVSTPRDTLTQLATLAGKVDALWMLPDATAVARETVEAYFRFSQEHNVPVVSFANAYLGLGAAAVLEIDRAELGRQASDMGSAILKGTEASDIPLAYPRRIQLRTNPSVMKHLGIAAERAALHPRE
ncbi:ABC transporter substrate-binding protein [Oryzomonas sagensis]|uniref:ABC transporter substrate-binding protein n=1 Tax=Oryzomonas sagensis TaxID=2603857 RepID=A0ABQ6TLW5_9BACT|nr:ABC transporter substrate binding protein [Oryzomonas sagensis]KAB0669444.1 ABC transporter substrate-binding protein [Oryzomonas sagensis]